MPRAAGQKHSKKGLFPQIPGKTLYERTSCLKVINLAVNGTAVPARRVHNTGMCTAAAIGVGLAAVCLALPLRTSSFRNAQYTSDTIATGKILVAREKLDDPNFTKTVVLIVDSDPDEGTLGVIINRRSDVALSKAFPNIKSAPDDPIYMGGPVEIGSGQGLLRSEARPEARHIVGDVYVTGSQELIESSVAAHLSPSKFRLYLGYAGWAPGQLEAEIQVGAWTVRSGNANIVFDENPDSLWLRLNRESHTQIAETRANHQRRMAENAGPFKCPSTPLGDEVLLWMSALTER
jgi:putative transcriptional regulator